MKKTAVTNTNRWESAVSFVQTRIPENHVCASGAGSPVLNLYLLLQNPSVFTPEPPRKYVQNTIYSADLAQKIRNFLNIGKKIFCC